MLTSHSLKLAELPIQRAPPHREEHLGGGVHGKMVLRMTSFRKECVASLWNQTPELSREAKRRRLELIARSHQEGC